jgi:DNA-binding PadR family transcriptional regulator
VYRITDEGLAVLKEHGDRATDFIDQVADLGERFSGAGLGEVTRSFVRLAQVSFERAARTATDPDALSRLKEILDQATRQMEEGEHA